jgi:hypothetical protein
MRLYLLFIAILASGADQNCHICGSRGNSALVHPKETCLQYGSRNCRQIAMDVMKSDLSQSQCDVFQKKYRLCCNNVVDLNCVEKDSFVIVTPDPDVVKYKGPYNRCNICGLGGVWTKNNQVMNMLYVGPGTCKTYYVAGLEGLIPNHLCDPLQFFVRDICGCRTPAGGLVV